MTVPGLDIIQVWKAQQTIDEYGRLGKVIGYFRTEQGAKIAAKGRGWYGSDGNVSPLYAVLLPPASANAAREILPLATDSPILLDSDLENMIRDQKRSALSKLTADDIRLLGLAGVAQNVGL